MAAAVRAVFVHPYRCRLHWPGAPCQNADGCDLANKIQYPGVRKSISSDVNNVATLLRLSGLLPSTLDIAPLLLEAKRQLRQEADYQAEGDRIVRLLVRLLFRELFEFALMQTDPNFANYRYDTLTGQLILLDFGASGLGKSL